MSAFLVWNPHSPIQFDGIPLWLQIKLTDHFNESRSSGLTCIQKKTWLKFIFTLFDDLGWSVLRLLELYRRETLNKRKTVEINFPEIHASEHPSYNFFFQIVVCQLNSCGQLFKNSSTPVHRHDGFWQRISHSLKRICFSSSSVDDRFLHAP